MTGIKQTHNKDRLKDRSDIGEVKSQIEKLMEFRDARASCVHIEAAMDADRDLTDTRKNTRIDAPPIRCHAQDTCVRNAGGPI
jgi:hypothetical protein